jgi:hypothetical protein
LEDTGEEVDRGWGENYTQGSIYGSTNIARQPYTYDQHQNIINFGEAIQKRTFVK